MDNKEKYLKVLQLIAIQQIQIEIIDSLIESNVLKQKTKFLAKNFLTEIEKFQKDFFDNRDEFKQTDKLLKFLDKKYKKLLSEIEIVVK
jgi:hypothetical protein